MSLSRSSGVAEAGGRGYYRYHAVPGNLSVLSRFREQLCRYWRMYYAGAVSAEARLDRRGLSSIGGFLVPALFIHIPMSALTLVSEGGAVCGNSASTESVRGVISDGHPYRDLIHDRENQSRPVWPAGHRTKRTIPEAHRRALRNS